MHAAELATRGRRALLIDVATHSLSVGVLGGARAQAHRSKNTPGARERERDFLPGKRRPDHARIPVFQGESDWADECTKLGEVVLTDLTVERRETCRSR